MHNFLASLLKTMVLLKNFFLVLICYLYFFVYKLIIPAPSAAMDSFLLWKKFHFLIKEFRESKVFFTLSRWDRFIFWSGVIFWFWVLISFDIVTNSITFWDWKVLSSCVFGEILIFPSRASFSGDRSFKSVWTWEHSSILWHR